MANQVSGGTAHLLLHALMDPVKHAWHTSKDRWAQSCNVFRQTVNAPLQRQPKSNAMSSEVHVTRKETKTAMSAIANQDCACIDCCYRSVLECDA